MYGPGGNGGNITPDSGRFPANLLLDEEAAAILDEQSGMLTSGDSGGASRFFYCAKASKSDRGDGNNHPTVKPLKLMEYLCTLTKTPTGGSVLDPFLGSGTTAIAAINTGRSIIGIEMNPDYMAIAKARLDVLEPKLLAA
jgi:site-specific DNA-methyltransferase (adenine-specific)